MEIGQAFASEIEDGWQSEYFGNSIVGVVDTGSAADDIVKPPGAGRTKSMNVDWKPLPPMWTSPAVWTDVGDLMLLALMENGVPTWEVHSKAKEGVGGESLIKSGTADTFEAAKAAALFEARPPGLTASW